jgi:hypothetical protein
MMNSLRGRLKKLEDSAPASQWKCDYDMVEHLARKKLSRRDAGLLDDAMALMTVGKQGEWSEAHRAIWDRWDATLATTAEEGGFLYLDVIDRLA